MISLTKARSAPLSLACHYICALVPQMKYVQNSFSNLVSERVPTPSPIVCWLILPWEGVWLYAR